MYNVCTLDDALAVYLTCLEERIESKAVVKQMIGDYIRAHYVAVDGPDLAERMGRLPVQVLDAIHERMALCFDFRDGKFCGIHEEG